MPRKRKVIEWGPEFDRILALERRSEVPEDLVDGMTEALKTEFGRMRLRPVQAQALAELLDYGLFGVIRVGGGKTLISLLCATVLEAERPLLIVPAFRLDPTEEAIRELRKHWDIQVPRLMTYAILGREEHKHDLFDIKPDLIVADEAHRLRHRTKSASAIRVERYLRERPETHFVPLSGTMQGLKVNSFRHLAAWALGIRSPVPLAEKEAKRWDQAMNPEHDQEMIAGGALYEAFGDDPGKGLGKWIRDTPGVVATHAVGCPASIVVHRWKATKVCEDLIREVDATGERPDGTPLTPGEQVMVKNCLSLGFWYKWDPAPPWDWLEARSDCCSLIRRLRESRDDIDSDGEAISRYPHLFKDWLEIKDSYDPQKNRKAVWIDDRVMKDALRWARETKGIVWSNFEAVGTYLGKHIPHYARLGYCGDRHIEKARGAISASIKSCGVGMNLQQYTDGLLLSPTPNAEILEQLIGRWHREGQDADEVRLYWNCTTSYYVDCLRRARADAEILQAQNHEPQKLCQASY